MAKVTLRTATINIWTTGCLLLILLIVAFGLFDWTGVLDANEQPPPAASSAAMDDDKTAGDAATAQRQYKFPITIRCPSGPPSIELPPPDALGHVSQVACSTCHSVRAANLANRSPSDLKLFHQNMPLSHGQLACYACHNPIDIETLRLADGTVVEYADVMNLCGQCHGIQAKAYARSFHGGMTGYWDLSRGGRERNNCIDCHDPHVPKFPQMQPTFAPRDRFLTAPVDDEPPLHDGHLPGPIEEREVDFERTAT